MDERKFAWSTKLKKLDKKRYIDTQFIASAQLVHFQLWQAHRTTDNRFGIHKKIFRTWQKAAEKYELPNAQPKAVLAPCVLKA